VVVLLTEKAAAPAGKTVNKQVMAAVEAALQERFGSHAGWAHNTLFIAELAMHRDLLPAQLQPGGRAKSDIDSAEAATPAQAVAAAAETAEAVVTEAIADSFAKQLGRGRRRRAKKQADTSPERISAEPSPMALELPSSEVDDERQAEQQQWDAAVKAEANKVMGIASVMDEPQQPMAVIETGGLPGLPSLAADQEVLLAAQPGAAATLAGRAARGKGMTGWKRRRAGSAVAGAAPAASLCACALETTKYDNRS
jgi:hypothetical protein